jgi:hypothetical protein
VQLLFIPYNAFLNDKRDRENLLSNVHLTPFIFLFLTILLKCTLNYLVNKPSITYIHLKLIYEKIIITGLSSVAVFTFSAVAQTNKNITDQKKWNKEGYGS